MRLYNINTESYRGSTVVKVAGSIPGGVSGFFIDIKYQEHFLGVKAAGA